jgi:hypothetical protein
VRRLRLLHVIAQPVLVWDDGQTLTPGPQVNVATVPATELAGLGERILAEIAQLAAQAEAQDSAAAL